MTTPRNLSPVRATLYGAGVVGAIDFAYATIFVVSRGRPWFVAWQGVASAVLGPAAFSGGYPTAGLGVFLHFCVATCIVAVYVIASRRLPLLTRHALPCGLAFGAAAFVVMNFAVVPLTRIGPHPFHWSAPFNVGGLLVHVLLLGPAAALFAGRVVPRIS